MCLKLIRNKNKFNAESISKNLSLRLIKMKQEEMIHFFLPGLKIKY